MEFEQAFELVRSFWPDRSLPFGGGGSSADVARLQGEFGCSFPAELATYVAQHPPTSRYSFETVGNPIDLYASHDLSKEVEGYNWNPLTHQALDGWSDQWVLLGDEGADPIIVDLSESRNPSGPCPVLQAPHGEGDWEFAELASSIPELLLLAAAQHHALTAFSPRFAAIVDDGRGFNLNEAAAAWYFPFVRRVAPTAEEMWLSIFDNARV